jgi:hypothetical protein
MLTSAALAAAVAILVAAVRDSANEWLLSG